MRYCVERPGAGITPLEIVECELAELNGGGVLVFLDAQQTLVRAFASGEWSTLTRVSDQPELPQPDLFRAATQAVVGIS